MNHRKKIKIIFVLALLGIIAGWTLALPEKTGLCVVNDIDCIHRYIYRYVTFVTVSIVFLSPILLISLILYFTSELVFYSWLRFSKYYLPVATIFIILSPTTDSSLLGFDKEFITWLLAGIFFLVSLGIIFFKHNQLGHPISK